MLFRIFCLLIIVAVAGCQTGQGDRAQAKEKPVAQVGDKILYRSEVAGLIPKGASATDSTTLVNRYVDSWVRKQLLLDQATREVEADEPAIEQKVQEYRNALLMYEFEKQYVKQHLDSNLTDQEMQTYYGQNLANFTLKQNIVQGRMVVLPKDAPKLDRARTLFRSGKTQDAQELNSYCYRFARSYLLDDSAWVNLETFLNNTPFREATSKAQFLQRNYFIETSDEGHIYWLLILDVRPANQTAPFSFVKDQIKGVILNKRRLALMQSLEKKTYEEARNKNKFKVYTQ